MRRQDKRGSQNKRLRTATSLLLAAVLLIPLAGCSPVSTVKGWLDPQSDQPVEKLTPKIKPPAIREAGKLSIGVNLGMAPFAANTATGYEGFDIELGKALAKHLGLEPVFVAVTPDQIVGALDNNKVDIALSASVDTTGVVIAQSYYQDTQVLFAQSGEASAVVATPQLPKTALQAGSAAESMLIKSMSSTDASATLQPYPTLSEALDAVDKKQATAVAGDYSILRYAQLSGAKIDFVRPLTTDDPNRGVAIRADNLELMREMKPLMVQLNETGALASIMRTWIGDNQLAAAMD